MNLVSQRKSWLIFLFFLVITVIFHSSSFLQSVMNHNESFHLLIAHSMITAYSPYTEIWYHKHTGIFTFLILLLIDNSVISIQIIACLAVATTAYLLYLIGKTCF